MVNSLGAKFGAPDIRDYKVKRKDRDVIIPETFECENMPAVKNQGQISSCVAHALATIVEWHSQRQGDSKEEMSTAFIYGNRMNSVNIGEGMITHDAVAAVMKCGTCEKRYLPKNIEVPDAIRYFKDNYFKLCDRAYKYRFTSYARIENDDDLKISLIKYGPVAICMNWYSDITWSGDKMIMNTTQERKNITGGHCMVIYGYNKIGWLVQNSWGSSWGSNGGRCIIPYNIKIREMYQIVDDYSERAQKARLEALEKANNEYREKIRELDDEIVKLNDSIATLLKYKILSEEQAKELEELLEKLNNHESELSRLTTELNKKNNEIEILKKELLEIKKPFKSPLGKFFAKIINGIINLFYLIFKR